MASNEMNKKISKKLSYLDMFKAGFAGDAMAQQRAKEKRLQEIEVEEERKKREIEAAKRKAAEMKK